MRSRVSDTSLELAFVNETETRVTVYWIDFKGTRVFYNSLAPGESYTQQTYVTHPWIVDDDDGRCLELLVPNAAGTYAVPIGARRNRPA